MNSPIAKTLWMGDIDSFIDEEFIYNIFANLSKNLKIHIGRYQFEIRENNQRQANRTETR